MNEAIIFDTEYTAWEGSLENNWSRPGEQKEIIQIAALKVEVKKNSILEKDFINIYVKPQINPELSPYIKNLTGISQRDIDEQGVDLIKAIELMNRFSENAAINSYSWGPDFEIISQNVFVLGLDPKKVGLVGQFTDLRDVFASHDSKYRTICSGQLHEVFGVTLSSQAHNAIHDVKSIYVAFNQILSAGSSWECQLLKHVLNM